MQGEAACDAKFGPPQQQPHRKPLTRFARSLNVSRSWQTLAPVQPHAHVAWRNVARLLVLYCRASGLCDFVVDAIAPDDDLHRARRRMHGPRSSSEQQESRNRERHNSTSGIHCHLKKTDFCGQSHSSRCDVKGNVHPRMVRRSATRGRPCSYSPRAHLWFAEPPRCAAGVDSLLWSKIVGCRW